MYDYVITNMLFSLNPGNRESPCSSDGNKNEWKDSHNEFGRRPRPPPPQHHQTSSSSRDLSPWEEEGGPDYRGNTGSRNDRYERNASMRGSRRRMNSCDEDYEYDPKYDRSRRSTKGG